MSKGKNTLTMVVNSKSLDDLVESLNGLADEAARPAAQAMAQVFYDEIKRNVSKIGRSTGNLERSVYQAYSATNSGPANATYHVSWNHKKAPHGQLVEWGHIQRYKVYINNKGEYKTAIRPEAKGKPKPRRRATQAEKDAYYVPLKAPRQVAAQPFIRPALNSRVIDMAVAAAQDALIERIFGGK